MRDLLKSPKRKISCWYFSKIKRIVWKANGLFGCLAQSDIMTRIRFYEISVRLIGCAIVLFSIAFILALVVLFDFAINFICLHL